MKKNKISNVLDINEKINIIIERKDLKFGINILK